MKDAYYSENTPELRAWLKEQRLTPSAYPDCYRQGLTAPYPSCTGEMIMYNDGVRHEDDDDIKDCIICATEEEFKGIVLQILESSGQGR